MTTIWFSCTEKNLFQCFSRGAEEKDHRSDHYYEVIVSIVSRNVCVLCYIVNILQRLLLLQLLLVEQLSGDFCHQSPYLDEMVRLSPYVWCSLRALSTCQNWPALKNQSFSCPRSSTTQTLIFQSRVQCANHLALHVTLFYGQSDKFLNPCGSIEMRIDL